MTFLAKYAGFFTVVCDFLAQNVGFSRPIRPKLLKIRILRGFFACRLSAESLEARLRLIMAGATGLEPATFGVTGRPVPEKEQGIQRVLTSPNGKKVR
jgi:hypothetical protein